MGVIRKEDDKVARSPVEEEDLLVPLKPSLIVSEQINKEKSGI